MTIEILAEICYEAMRKATEGALTPWARIPKAEKVAFVEQTEKVLAGEEGDPLHKTLVQALAPFAGMLEPLPAETSSKVVLYNHNPPMLAIEQDGKTILIAELAVGSRVTANGHTQSHQDYPRETSTELLSL